MINTVSIKQQQLTKGFFTTGSGSEVMLIMGSCRVAPYIQYMHDWNEANGNRFTIHSLDGFNHNWNEKDERIDYSQKLKELESDSRLTDMFKSVDIFIHEFYKNAGLFNCDKGANGGIYDFGMAANHDICIPSWNDIFVLFLDILAFDTDMRKKAIQDINVTGKLSEQTQKEIRAKGVVGLDKFFSVCQQSDVPEMSAYFGRNFKQKRFWHSYNHVTKNFTLEVFKLINDKFLHLDLSKGFNEDHVDMFANSFTKLTEYDVEAYGYDWGEEIVSLKDKIMG